MKATRLLASGPQCQVVFLLLNFKIILLDHLPFSFKHAKAKIMSFYNNIKKTLRSLQVENTLSFSLPFTAKHAPTLYAPKKSQSHIFLVDHSFVCPIIKFYEYIYLIYATLGSSSYNLQYSNQVFILLKLFKSSVWSPKCSFKVFKTVSKQALYFLYLQLRHLHKLI